MVLKRKIGYSTEQEPDVPMEGERDEEEEDRVQKKSKLSDSVTPPSDGRSPSTQLQKMNLDS